MPEASYPADVRARALELYVTHGAAEASRQTDVAAGTIRQWARRSGVTVTRAEQTKAAVEASKLSMEQRRQHLAEDLLADAERLRKQLWSPTEVFHWGQETFMDDRTGRASASATVFQAHEIAQPTFGDQKQIVLACAVAIDKSQLLSGQVTERMEMITNEDVQTIDNILELRRSA